ncbi:zinc finger protein 184-like [Microcaecilia unicolor]|uniref:Zinc finger protein 184-like n=1 Tax=Microcaecilia unicolor TaxID=1415580 RepID=A0A6P7XE25_9AMPH|nr:zinc finger protein 184-like [Microcaecilia unicolor]
MTPRSTGHSNREEAEALEYETDSPEIAPSSRTRRISWPGTLLVGCHYEEAEPWYRGLTPHQEAERASPGPTPGRGELAHPWSAGHLDTAGAPYCGSEEEPERQWKSGALAPPAQPMLLPRDDGGTERARRAASKARHGSFLSFCLNLQPDPSLQLHNSGGNRREMTALVFDQSKTGSPNVRPDILIRFKKQEFRTETQGSKERGNLLNTGTCEDLHETDHGYRYNSKKLRLCNGQQREQWIQKDPFRDSPDPSECEGSSSRITAPRVKDRAENRERSNSRDRNSNCCQSLVQTQGRKEGERPFKGADTQENVTTDRHFVEKDIILHKPKVPYSHTISRTDKIVDTATQGKLFKCSEYDTCFSQRINVQQHKVTHTWHKPFKCSECDKSFSQRSNLQQHKVTHTGHKPFKCSECNKCFSQQGTLKQHKMTGCKPFKCSECEKCFNFKAIFQQCFAKA